MRPYGAIRCFQGSDRLRNSGPFGAREITNPQLENDQHPKGNHHHGKDRVGHGRGKKPHSVGRIRNFTELSKPVVAGFFSKPEKPSHAAGSSGSGDKKSMLNPGLQARDLPTGPVFRFALFGLIKVVSHPQNLRRLLCGLLRLYWAPR